MSARLYVLFKTNHEPLSLAEIAMRINLNFPGWATADSEDGMVDLHGPWAGYLTTGDSLCPSADLSYLFCYFWAYWDDVLNDKSFRRYVMKLCDALGVNEWVYIEETSMDYLEDLSAKEFVEAVNNAVGIERFEMPLFFPIGSHHLFKDSSQRVQSLMD